MLDDAYHRCFKLVTQLNARHGWELGDETLGRYASKIVACCTNIAQMTDTQINVSIQYYHKEHRIVEALLDASHPEHSERWSEWTRQTMGILISKTAGSLSRGDVTVSLEDLAQEAIHDLWRGLPSFSYQSTFFTWAFTIIGHCLARFYRAQQTQKRAALPPAQSLDALLASGDTIYSHATPPDMAALNSQLAKLVDDILRQHPDRRIALIFHLWANEEQTLRVIGDQLNLSPARVHALLKQAIALLRNEQALQRWVAQDVIKEIAS